MAPTPLYDDVADEYDRWVSGESTILDDATFTDLVGPVRGQQVCAVACGTGREARYLAIQGASVTGVDLSSRMLAIARERERQSPLGITYLEDDAQDLALLEDASFDGATCYMALMDIPDLDRTLDAIARILRPNGWFVFTITHPCFKPPAYGELVDHVTGSVRRIVGRYFAEGAWEGPGKDGGRLPERAYHRTLSTYVNALVNAGFMIDAMREPPLDTPVWREAACLLYVRCHQTDRPTAAVTPQDPG